VWLVFELGLFVKARGTFTCDGSLHDISLSHQSSAEIMAHERHFSSSPFSFTSSHLHPSVHPNTKPSSFLLDLDFEAICFSSPLLAELCITAQFGIDYCVMH